MKKKEIFSNIGFVLVVASLIVILVYQKNIKVVVFAASFGLFVYGLITLMKERIKGIITCVFSVSLAISGALYFFKVFNLMKAFTFMMSFTVFWMMVLTAFFAYKQRKLLCSKYSIETEAEVIDLIVNPNTEEKYYQPYYKYEIDGEEYDVLYPAFINKNVPNIGDKTKIRVDPNDRDSIYFEKRIKDKVFDVALIIFFILVSLLIMVGQFIW